MKRLIWAPERLIWALVCLLALASPSFAQAPLTCNASVIYAASTNGSTRLLVAPASGPTYVCGFSIWAGGTVAVKLIQGTGTACATGSVDLTPAFALTTQTGIIDSSSFFRGLVAPTGKDLCLNTNAGVAVQAIVYYRRFP